MLPFVRFDYRPGPLPVTLLDPSFAIIWLLGGACAIGAAWQANYHRLAALILTSGAGLSTCISFVWLSAPDLGVTQLLVEIVTPVLLLLALRLLPPRVPQLRPKPRMPLSVGLPPSVTLLLVGIAGEAHVPLPDE